MMMFTKRLIFLNSQFASGTARERWRGRERERDRRGGDGRSAPPVGRVLAIYPPE